MVIRYNSTKIVRGGVTFAYLLAAEEQHTSRETEVFFGTLCLGRKPNSFNTQTFYRVRPAALPSLNP